ncbi:hypothetical protein JAAARDRAFT_194800 [Jaapia argillacea MUCL 33604]|uniref:Uncharacterized protein n=1 Tax=Jaapia argillacea MUCL 33604 TaxID=933084 RepID=A0A067PSP4_9AGAM|nr:hypothetical protein JAAARDRAFT_194800 [Jaapia argillacea MUCL 33604]
MSITIHQFTNVSPPPLSSPTIWDRGAKLVNDATNLTGWTSTKSHPNSTSFLPSHNIFQYSKPPPTLGHKSSKRTSPWVELKEWDAPVDDEEIYSTQTLDEFQSTDFECLFHPEPKRSRQLPPKPPRTHLPSAHDPAPPPKRFKLTLETLQGPLNNLIPHPHYHSTQPIPIPLHPPKTIPPYTKSPIVPISPYNLSQVHALLANQYVRTAWIIPIRGSPPFSSPQVESRSLSETGIHSFSETGNRHHHLVAETRADGPSIAQILHPNSQPSSTSTQTHITWHPPTLLSFWHTLLSIHKTKTFGPIGLSFHPSPSPPDYIKIYHNAHMAMVLRNVLDAWSYPPPLVETKSARNGNGGKGDGMRAEGKTRAKMDKTKERPTSPLPKIRILKDKKLVLVDSCGKGVCLV